MAYPNARSLIRADDSDNEHLNSKNKDDESQIS